LFDPFRVEKKRRRGRFLNPGFHPGLPTFDPFGIGSPDTWLLTPLLPDSFLCVSAALREIFFFSVFSVSLW